MYHPRIRFYIVHGIFYTGRIYYILVIIHPGTLRTHSILFFINNHYRLHCYHIHSNSDHDAAAGDPWKEIFTRRKNTSNPEAVQI